MKSVLVAPMDWGLGHASRCIPIIRELMEQKCRVVIAGSGDSLTMLALEFPGLTRHEIPGYKPTYPASGNMAAKMAAQIPGFLETIREEHSAIERLVDEERLSLVIADNRYGCWSAKVPSILITHQSNILMPARFGWMQFIVRQLVARYMKRFSRCWIPDTPDARLSGELISFGKLPRGIKAEFIGHLSRFTASGTPNQQYDVVAVLSGPEPQRSILEEKILPQLEASGLRYFVVRGQPSGESNGNGRTAAFLTSAPLQAIIESSGIVIARCGYSTVMDLAALGKKAIFIPTPGQTEQEYLAERLHRSGVAFAVEQDKFSLKEALDRVRSCKGFPQPAVNENEMLKTAIASALS